jgi:hypothetical protein
MLHLRERLGEINNHRLQGEFITETFRARFFYAILNPDEELNEGIEHFRIIKDVEGEGQSFCPL